MGRRPSNKPTSFDIADLAGVSQPTVSRALRGSKAVSLATRQKIEAIARDLNYSIEKPAHAACTGRTNTLALLLLEHSAPDRSAITPLHLDLLGAITRQCAGRGLDLLVSVRRPGEDWHLHYLDHDRVDGLMVLGDGDGDGAAAEPSVAKIAGAGIPIVRWGRCSADGHGVTMGTDDFGAGRLVGKHLLAAGRRRVAFLGKIGGRMWDHQQRYAGLVKALANAGVAIDRALVVDAGSSEKSGFDAARKLIAGGVSFDAIFAASDAIALGAMRALIHGGSRIPNDVAVVGFGDSPGARSATTPLSSVARDIGGAGQALVEGMLSQIEGMPTASRVLPMRLVVRASSGGA